MFEQQQKVLKGLVNAVKAQNVLNDQQTKINAEILKAINMLDLRIKQLEIIARRN